MARSCYVVALYLFINIFNCDAARILAVYPVPSYSHQIVFQPITLELVKRGHEVVVITPNPIFRKGEAPKNLTEIDVHDISYEVWRSFMETSKGNKEDLSTQVRTGLRVTLKTVDQQLQVKEIKNLIKNKQKFDLLLLEAFVRPALGWSHVYKIPVIQISSFGALFDNYEVVGAPTHPFLYPQILNQRIYNLTIYEKLYELYNEYIFDRIFENLQQEEHSIMKKHFGADVPSIEELQNNVDMLFLNVNPIWEGNRPVPPSVIHMGGLPKKPHKELPAHKYFTMARSCCVVAFYLFINIFTCDAARILAVYPVPSYSHQIVFQAITLELVKRGHEMVVITPDPIFRKGEAPKNLTEIDVHDISYEVWRSFMETSKGNKEDLSAQLRVGLEVILKTVEKQLEVKETKDLIKNKQKIDLLLLEASVRPALGWSHVYKVPVIQISSFGAIFDNYEVFGAPTHPFLYPPTLNQRIYNLTMYEKLYELYNKYTFDNLVESIEEEEYNIMKKHFGDDVPRIKELKNNVDMLFLNINSIWEGNRPVPPSVVHMGGLPTKPHKELPTDLKSYLDSSKNGVIYISFGTNVQPSLLPPEKIQVLVKAFSKLPYDVLWKWDKDDLPGRSSNIKLSKWLPQSDLLRHPKIKVFVTQGGLQSTDEAILAGVPLIGVPMLGDQWYNVEKYVHHGIGLQLDLETLNEEIFSNAINKVIDDKSYRDNINRLRGLMIDQPMNALDRAIWWIEHVLRHGGGKHLRAPAANITWSQYLELELVAIVLSVLLMSLLLFVGAVFYLYKFIANNYISKTKVKSS